MRNPGPTRTHFPFTASPLRDTGSPTTCPPVDQRGEPRPTDGDGNMIAACDIGAVEAVPEPSAVDSDRCCGGRGGCGAGWPPSPWRGYASRSVRIVRLRNRRNFSTT